jgi:hypothetical protein
MERDGERSPIVHQDGVGSFAIVHESPERLQNTFTRADPAGRMIDPYVGCPTKRFGQGNLHAISAFRK